MRDSTFVKCILASAALHAATMVLFFNKPLHFYPRFLTHLGKNAPMPLEEDGIVILKKDDALEEAFRGFAVLSPHAAAPHDAIKFVSAENYTATIEEKPLAYEHPLLFPDDQELELPKVLPVQPLEIASDNISARMTNPSVALRPDSPSIEPSGETVNPFEDLPIPYTAPVAASEGLLDFEFLPSKEKFTLPPPLYPTISSPSLVSSETIALPDQQIAVEATPALPAKPDAAAPPIFQQQPAIAAQYAFPSLSGYGIPELTTLDWNEIFEVDIKTLAREEGGYLFSLTFIPKVDLSQHKLKQNYYFLIDRSNSIEKNRYQCFKRGVLRAIASLKENDLFNVAIFDSKVSKLSETSIVYNKKNQRLAEEFLEKQPHGNYGPPTDLYSSLLKIIPSDVNENEAHTAILISTGVSKIKPEKQRTLINAWLEANRGKVVLYTAAVGSDNNLGPLDLLGTSGRGALMHSDTNTAFPRKLAKLILTLRSPIAKEMTLSVSDADPASRLQLFPSPSRLPYLFSDHPFVLFGTAEKLTDFTLMLEGKNKDQLMTIKKTVAFSKAKPGTRLLSKQWASEQAHLFYEQYLQEGKPALLEEAQKLLADEPQNSRR
jgi:hypothetical protein